jgi:hypothetical protein
MHHVMSCTTVVTSVATVDMFTECYHRIHPTQPRILNTLARQWLFCTILITIERTRELSKDCIYVYIYIFSVACNRLNDTKCTEQNIQQLLAGCLYHADVDTAE